VSDQSVRARIAAAGGTLSAAQRRLADLVVADPEAVAFGTVRSVAASSRTSDPTVVRFATTLGYGGFTGLRDAVRGELSTSLASAAQRVRRAGGGPLVEPARDIERANVVDTLDRIDEADLARALDVLADLDRRIWLLPSSQTEGIAAHLADNLQLCRPAVVLLDGGEFRVRTALAGLRRGDVLVSLDTQRHERWLVRTQHDAVAAGAVPVVLTDRLPCSLDLAGGMAFTFACRTTGLFDSLVGLLALGNLLVSGVGDRRRDTVTPRIDAAEAAWVEAGLLET
jgi:DNA-binding MurR/RpiR family transcriptional regulator